MVGSIVTLILCFLARSCKSEVAINNHNIDGFAYLQHSNDISISFLQDTDSSTYRQEGLPCPLLSPGDHNHHPSRASYLPGQGTQDRLRVQAIVFLQQPLHSTRFYSAHLLGLGFIPRHSFLGT